MERLKPVTAPEPSVTAVPIAAEPPPAGAEKVTATVPEDTSVNGVVVVNAPVVPIPPVS